MVIQAQRATLEDLWALQEKPENENKRFELLNGVIYEVDMAEPKHARISNKFGRYLDEFAEANDLGYVFGDSCTYTLPNGDELIPDASFVSKLRVSLPFPKKFQIAPDLAVEVASPSNTEPKIINKVESYLESGTKIVWVAYPDEQKVYAYRRNPDGSLLLRKFTIEQELDGEEVLPGFKLPVKNVFPKE
jgi:Uma2 family endonuclease